MKLTEFAFLIPMLLITVLVLGIEIRRNADKVIRAQKEKADELLAKFQDILNDKVRTLQEGIDDLKKQPDQGDTE